jgi:uncharacterized protein (DUF3084 family)
MQSFLKELNTLIENVGFENAVFLLISIGLSALCYFLLRLQAKSQDKIDLILDDAEECKSDRESLRLELQQTKTRNEELDQYNKEARKELLETKASHNAVVESFNDSLKLLIDKL